MILNSTDTFRKIFRDLVIRLLEIRGTPGATGIGSSISPAEFLVALHNTESAAGLRCVVDG